MYKVIVIDDNKLLADSLAELDLWGRMDLKVADVCYNAVTGKESILRNRPHIVLSDIRLPGMDGLELVSIVQSRLPQTKVVFMSAYSDFSYMKQAMRLRAEDYLLKPFDMDELAKVMENIVRELDKTSARSEGDVLPDSGSLALAMQPIIDYIKNRLESHITAEEVADAFCMGTSKLDRLIKEYTGVGFRELRIRLRIERAKELLTDVRYSVEEVAGLVGYKNYVTFYRAFSRECGCAPSEYREQFLKKDADSWAAV